MNSKKSRPDSPKSDKLPISQFTASSLTHYPGNCTISFAAWNDINNLWEVEEHEAVAHTEKPKTI